MVGITQADVKAQDRWPISDQTLAQVLANLQRHGPSAIALDLYRDTPQPPGETALALQLQRPNVFSTTELGDFGLHQIAPPAQAPAHQVGFNDFVIDLDGTVRRQLVLMEDGEGNVYTSLALLLARYYIQHNPHSGRSSQPGPAQSAHNLTVDGEQFTLGRQRFPSLSPQAGGYVQLDAAGWQILLNYRGGDAIAPTLSLGEVLADDFDPALIKDKIILIGNTASSSKDLFETPYSSGLKTSSFLMPGVIVHAQFVSQLLRVMLEGEPIWRFWAEPLEYLWAWLWAMVGGVLFWRLKHPGVQLLMGLLGLGGLAGITWLLFAQLVWVPLIFPVMTFAMGSASLLAYKEFFRAFYDPLTGLPNRDRFLQLLEESLRRRQRSPLSTAQAQSMAVMFLDLDQFKDVNESLGHKNGDQLLLTVSKRLQQALPRYSYLARLGGDEFGIVLNRLASTDQAQQIVNQLQQSLSPPIRLQGREVFTSASFGVALAPPDQLYRAEMLLRDAHTATYRAKAQGKARHEVFAQGMRADVVEQFRLENDLHQALERQELFLVYQPFVDLQSQRVTGFEALVRWQHPERGLISPGVFIPVAEKTGLIRPLGRWVLRRACEQMVYWQQKFPEQSLIISVNLSSEQFTEPDLADQIRAILQGTGINPATLKLELTESMMMGDVERAIQTLLALKQLGLKLGLDDFGTGYSSLSYLHRFPIDTLKIDLSFVRHMTEASENAAIAKTIVELGHSLSMDVIAEGVEKPEQAAALLILGCEYGQGYFFSKPALDIDAEQLLQQKPAWDY